MKDYLERVIDKELEIRLQAFGATLIVGPKWCGKTTTGARMAKSIIKMQDPDMREGYLSTAAVKPSLLLKGDNPRLIDEWQDAPVIWDAVRTEVDERKKEGLFILTGSNTVDDKKIYHTGTGRISRLKMYPMSLFESLESNGKISLKDIFLDKKIDIDGMVSTTNIEDIIFAACRGGWPSSLYKKSDVAKLLIAKEYLNNICESDISDLDGVTRNPNWAKVILRSYARNVSTLAKKSIIYKDVTGDNSNMSMNTMETYINSFERLFVLEDIPAWSPSIRSATAIRSGRKIGFVDPSIAVAALGLSPEKLSLDLKTFGFIFECLCIRDLKVYTSSMGGKISYYNDRYGLEADAVLHLENGMYALIEIKLGSRDIETGAENLKKIRKLVKENGLKEPDLLIVITGGNMAYTRPDGVKVIPITCLRD